MLLSYLMNKNYQQQLMVLLSFAASLTHNAAQNLLHLQKLNIHMIHHTTLCPQIVDEIVLQLLFFISLPLEHTTCHDLFLIQAI